MFPTHKLELDWIAAFQGNGAFAELMLKVSYLGSQAFAYVLPFVYFVLSRPAGAKLYLLFSVSNSLLYVFKLGFHLPRPYWIDTRIQPLSGAGGYGMPSGHVLSATVVWPFVAKTLGKAWAWFIAVTLVLLVSVSRVYLGVHFISDVVAAWCIAAGLLWSFGWMERRFTTWLNSLSLWWQIATALWTAAVLLLMGLGVKAWIAGVIDPPTWSMYSAGTRSPDGFFSPVGEFFGAACGIMMAGRSASFEVSGALWKRGTAYGYALMGAWLIRELARMIPAPDAETLQLSFNFLRRAVSNVWMLFLAPWILLKVGLLHPAASVSALNGLETAPSTMSLR